MPCQVHNHQHKLWPKSGTHRLLIEACETQCGWCEYKTAHANNLRVHARRHIANPKSDMLRNIEVIFGKAGRSRVPLPCERTSLSLVPNPNNLTSQSRSSSQTMEGVSIEPIAGLDITHDTASFSSCGPERHVVKSRNDHESENNSQPSSPDIRPHSNPTTSTDTDKDPLYEELYRERDLLLQRVEQLEGLLHQQGIVHLVMTKSVPSSISATRDIAADEGDTMVLRQESNTMGSFVGGMSWGSVGSWIRDEYMMGTSPAAFSNSSPSFHSSSFLPKMEAAFMKDFTCCGLTLASLHDLLQHFEETHTNAPAPHPHKTSMTMTIPAKAFQASQRKPIALPAQNPAMTSTYRSSSVEAVQPNPDGSESSNGRLDPVVPLILTLDDWLAFQI